MPFAIKTSAGVLVRLDDVPGRQIEEIAKAHEMGWFTVLMRPAMTFQLGLDIVRLGHEIANETPPADLADWTPRQLDLAIVEVADDLPSSFEDGLPKEAADQVTTS